MHEDMVLTDWKAVISSDESKFNLFGSDGRNYCRRRVGEEFLEQNVRKTVKHGNGSLMVWGCVTAWGTGRLIRIDGIMDAVKYIERVEEGLLGTLSDYGLTNNDVIFQQDNNPKHTSKLAQKFFDDNEIFVLPWAPQSPDMNVIEHVWDHLDKLIRKWDPLPKNLDELWEALREEWENLDIAYIQNLYSSWPRRVAALVKAEGKYTKY